MLKCKYYIIKMLDFFVFGNLKEINWERNNCFVKGNSFIVYEKL